MKRFLFCIALLLVIPVAFSQTSGIGTEADTSADSVYRATATKINELIHTKLEVSFDIPESVMYGKALLTLKPYFYPTDSLTLDTKYMDIKEVALITGKTKTILSYAYDSLQLRINLGKTFKKNEKYNIYIDYTAHPEKVRTGGSQAITDAKGLYFINPKGDGQWPTQIWTQGETESNSVWMPTIDKTNQKTTQEISMTIPGEFVTLSNGVLTSQKNNKDGTRTDTWKLDLPHAPYLVFMGAGDFAIVKDQYKGMEVNYYVEKAYEPVARKIFGETPKMIEYFSKILDVPYPWPGYDQMVARGYVSGAMENTTATLHQDGAYQNARELVDGNKWESVIAHELFHHWFGDLVTTESWSNITLNESFANYSQYLWDEYRHGKDFADANAFDEMQGYLASNSSHQPLVRFYYHDREDVFDAVSYNKGGRVLHMLRNIVGDEAFFTSLNQYLNRYKFKSTEAHQLRLIFEEVTGMDLNWFWNQWYFGAGEPHLDISYQYTEGIQQVFVKQTRDGPLFTMPVAIDLYNTKGVKTKHRVWLRNKADTFSFVVTEKPVLVNVDAEKTLLAVKKDNKGLQEYEYQYQLAGNYLDRREATEFFGTNHPASLKQVLDDPYPGLRKMAIEFLQNTIASNDAAIHEKIRKIATSDRDRLTRAAALGYLAVLKDGTDKELFQKSVTDSSYSVAGAALTGLMALDPDHAYQTAKALSDDAKGKLNAAVSEILFTLGNENEFELLKKLYRESELSDEKILGTMKFAGYLGGLKDPVKVKEGADEIMAFRNSIPEQYRFYIDSAFKQAFANMATRQIRLGNNEVAEYVRTLIP